MSGLGLSDNAGLPHLGNYDGSLILWDIENDQPIGDREA